ncbi:SDR family NAD(P)-dependent oxidoreductase [Curvibacter sp. CHRR-16]|nr:SDR family NAD(P)-dependent oxidoreductase [Curvibacter sp. CHRR-16]
MDFAGQVAIVTGAGAGLGRAYALALASRGAKVVVNDVGDAAHAVVADIEAAGGQAMAPIASVTDFAAVQAMVEQVVQRWGRVDMLVNNAGILRDKSFAKMELEDFRLVLDVHLMGSVHCCKAVWPIMQAQNYGRIVMTTSSSGLYGNFGQSNYSAAKMALVGLMQTLALEGHKHHIHVNSIAPTAATGMTQGLLPEAMLAHLQPEAVVPAVLTLLAPSAPTRTILCAGAGHVEAAHITLTQGQWIGMDGAAPERLQQQLSHVLERTQDMVPSQGMEQGQHELQAAMRVAAAATTARKRQTAG